MNEDKVISVVVIKESGATYVNTSGGFGEDIIFGIQKWIDGYRFDGVDWIKDDKTKED
jgi:hypothetical protein